MAILAAFPSIPLLSSGSTIPNNNFLSIPRWIKRPQTLPFLQRFLPSKTLRCSSENHRPREKLEERLFSNLNQTSLKREPGSVISGIFLVGAGILAIPAVTQESGFLASTIACILCWIYMVVSGLLIAEVNVNTMCELGSGGVSLVTMARRTLGNVGVQVVCWSYIFIHYALLVANVSRSSNILTSFLNIPLWESAALFSLVFGSICYFGRVWLVGISIRNIFLEQILKQFHQVYQ